MTGKVVSGNYLFGRKDHLRWVGDELWVAGADRAEVWLQTLEPLTDPVFEIRSLVPDHEIHIEIERPPPATRRRPRLATRDALTVATDPWSVPTGPGATAHASSTSGSTA